MLSNSAAVTVNLSALAENWRYIRDYAGTRIKTVAAAVKANAYGLGAPAVANALLNAGCNTFFVATIDEGMELRQAIDRQNYVTIAILHGLSNKEEARAASSFNLTPVLKTLYGISLWEDEVRQRNQALPAFIQLDTGINRLGLTKSEINEYTASRSASVDAWRLFNPITWLSHLSCADERDNPLNRLQLARLRDFIRQLPAHDVSLCNSSGVFLGAEYHFDMLRPGAALYGINPTPDRQNPMQQVVTLNAPVLQVRDVASGESVGYGATFVANQTTRIATLGIGYADGYMRSLSNKGIVAFGQFTAPVVGRISMDLTTVDVTSIPEEHCHAGTQAIIIGKHMDVDGTAAAADTIGYELLTRLGGRIRRIYNSN